MAGVNTWLFHLVGIIVIPIELLLLLLLLWRWLLHLYATASLRVLWPAPQTGEWASLWHFVFSIFGCYKFR